MTSSPTYRRQFGKHRAPFFIRALTSLAFFATASFAVSAGNLNALDAEPPSELALTIPAFTGGEPLSRYLISVDPSLSNLDVLSDSLADAGATVVDTISDFNTVVAWVSDDQVAALRDSVVIDTVEPDSVLSVDTEPEPNGEDASVPLAGPIPGRYIITIDRSANATTRASIVSALGDSVIATYENVFRGYAVELTDAEAKSIKALPGVLSVENDAVITLDSSTDLQPLATQPDLSAGLWGLDRLDQTALPLDQRYTYDADGTGVTAYVIDTGVSDHDEFGDRLKNGRRYYNAGWDWLPWITYDSTTDDCNGHGTHVAGTIAGTTYGVAKNADIIPVRVFGCNGSTSTSIIVEAIDWVVAHHRSGVPAVANLSLGGGASTALDSAVRAMVNDGIVVAVAAGNSNQNACYSSPARESSAFTVAASTSSDSRASFSNFGSCVDVFAPGLRIQSAWPSDVSPYTTQRTISGTSMASPHVAGAAALIWSRDLTATSSDVSDVLKTSHVVGKISDPGTGSPNQLLHLGSADVIPTAPLNPVATASGGVATVSWEAPENAESAGVTGYSVIAINSENVETDGCDWSGGLLECSVAGLAPGSWTFAIQASNAAGISPRSTPSNSIDIEVSNDFFSGATELLGRSGSIAANNRYATLEDDEPSLGVGFGGATLWFTYTPSSDGSLTVNTQGSTFDTVLTAYRGSSLTSLTRLAINDDYRFEGSYTLQSQVSFTVKADTKYYLRVHSWGSARGDVELNWDLAASCTTRAVPNDDFCTASAFTGESGSDTVDITDATIEPGEPGEGDRSIWYRHTPNADGTLSLSRAGTAIASTVDVYTGSDLESLLPVTGSSLISDTAAQSASFEVRERVTYFIRHASRDGDTGDVTTGFTFTPTPVLTIPERPISVSASDDGSDAVVAWTPPTNDGGSPIIAYEVTATPDDASCSAVTDETSCVLSGLRPWTRYTLNVVAINEIGRSSPRSMVYIPANSNDSFATPVALQESANGMTISSNRYASAEYAEPAHVYGPYHSMWFEISVPSAGRLEIDTAGSNFDTTLAAYEGTSLSALRQVAQNDDASGTLTSAITLSPTSPTSYRIAVDGYNGNTGSIRLNWTFTAAGPPQPPSEVKAVATGVNSVNVWWTTPDSTMPITSSTATAHPGGASCETTTTQCEITGLVTGAQYTFSVSSSNALGSSAPTSPSQSVIVGSSNGAQTSIPNSWGQDRIDQTTLPLDDRFSTTNRGNGSTIFIVDTGISAHTEFAGRLTTGYDSINDGNGTTDCHGHGTHVASTAAGETLGVASDALVVPVRVLDCDGSGSTSGVLAGLSWIRSVDLGTRRGVVNLSLGGGASTTLDNAVAQLTAEGFVVTVAAGNEAQNACDVSPAREPAALTVGATTQSDARSWYSNFGSCIDLFAPGDSIVGAGLSSSTARQTMSGTSMASPHAAGAAAIAFTAWPSASPSDVIRLLVEDATTNVLSSIGTDSPNRLLMVAGESLPASDTPSTPHSVSAEADDSSITIRWMPGDPSVVAVTSFTVTGSPEGLCTTEFVALQTEHSCVISNLENGVEYSFSVVAVNAAGVASSASDAVEATPSVSDVQERPSGATPDESAIAHAATISQITPTRVADTRQPSLSNRSSAKVSNDRLLRVNVADATGLEASEIEAVALNLTLTETSAGPYGGFATVFPCGSSVPDTSSLNFVGGQTVATGVLSAVGTNGDVCIYVFGEAHVIVDVSGVIAVERGYTSFVPVRQADTRRGSGGSISERIVYRSLEIPVGALGGVASTDVAAISATLTVTSTVAPVVGGFATVYACDSTPPDASTLNFTTGQTIANSFISPLSRDGTLCVYIYGEADVIVDINGVFSEQSAFSAMQPSRVLDTRSSGAIGTLTNEATDLVVPIGVGAQSLADLDTVVTLNVTAVGTVAPATGGFLTVYPCGARPDTSTLNFVTGQTVANSMVAPVSAEGTVCVFVYGKADVLIDINGVSHAK